jgi:hypothetical protein
MISWCDVAHLFFDSPTIRTAETAPAITAQKQLLQTTDREDTRIEWEAAFKYEAEDLK